MKVKLFGMAKDIAGNDHIILRDTEEIRNVKDLKERLKKDYPGFNRIPTMAIAVNVNYARDNDPVTEQDEVVVIPPVSGG